MMEEVILSFPQQFNVGIKAAEGVSLKNFKRKYDNIIICGMGGSGLPGSILRGLLPLNIFCHKSYGLPKPVGKGSLVFCVSYSGNTEETISAFKEARRKNLDLVVVSSGGQLENFSKKFDVPWVKISAGVPPRMALGYQFSALVGILFKLKLVGNSVVKEVSGLEKKLGKVRVGKGLAKELKGRIPLVYASEEFKEVAYIWKILFNETAKNIAFFNLFPELCHNEIEGLEKVGLFKNKLAVVILRDRNGDSRILKRMKIVGEMFKKKGIKVKVVEVKGRSFLEKVFSTILLGYWGAYYLALENKVDPMQVEMIEELKEKMMR